MNGETLVTLVAVLLGVLLLFSGVGKLVDRSGFWAALSRTYGFSDRMATRVAFMVPVSEVVVAVALLSPYRAAGLVTATVLLGSVATVTLRAWLRGAAGDCGCFGRLRRETFSARTVMRAMSLFGVALFAIATEFGWPEPSLPATRLDQTLALGLAVSGAVLAAALIGAALMIIPAVLRGT
ncbi:MAG: MauE/DoxX family redox-associated membrane protein [Candidatus Limnocylindria bacterium]